VFENLPVFFGYGNYPESIDFREVHIPGRAHIVIKKVDRLPESLKRYAGRRFEVAAGPERFRE
jgi:hypothetical protein